MSVQGVNRDGMCLDEGGTHKVCGKVRPAPPRPIRLVFFSEDDEFINLSIEGSLMSVVMIPTSGIKIV